VTQRAPRKERLALDVGYALVTETTFYTRHGDWFGWLCVIIAGVGTLVRWNVRGGVLRSRPQ
jgi:apolipoprotein N-acyltransferase